MNRADASGRQAASDAGESRASRRIAELHPPSAPGPESRSSLGKEPDQDDQAARLDELLARAGQAVQRIAAQQAERHASSDYAARMELQAQTRAEAGLQAQARDEAELELLFRSLSALPDKPLDQMSIKDTACAWLPGQHHQAAEQAANEQAGDRGDQSVMIPAGKSVQARSGNRAPHRRPAHRRDAAPAGPHPAAARSLNGFLGQTGLTLEPEPRAGH